MLYRLEESQNSSEVVIGVKGLRGGEVDEMVVVIYESVDAGSCPDPNTEMEATNSKRKPEIHNTGTGKFCNFLCIMKSTDVTSTVRYIVGLKKALVRSLITHDPMEYSLNVH